MKRMISLFEGKKHALLYSKYRPTYPENLASTIIDYYKQVNPAITKNDKINQLLDVGCGNGQATFQFANCCSKIYATDTSSEQIKLAQNSNPFDNVTFSTGTAENMNIESRSTDIITAGQCAHWINLPKFFTEAERVLVPGGLIAIFGYCTPTIEYCQSSGPDQNDTLKTMFSEFYSKCIWHPNRRHVENKFSEIFELIPYQSKVRYDDMVIERIWSIEELGGYISSWSGYQAYAKQYGQTLDQLLKQIQNHNDNKETKIKITWDVFLLMSQTN